MKRTRLTPKERKRLIMEAALKVSRDVGYNIVSREDIAKEAGIAPSLVSNHWGTMTQLRRSIMRSAVKQADLVIIAQGLVREDRIAQKADDELKRTALARLV